MLIVVLYKLYQHRINPNEKRDNPKSWDNRITFYCVIIYPFYYFFDASLTVYEGTLFNTCRFAFWFHHVVNSFDYIFPTVINPYNTIADIPLHI